MNAEKKPQTFVGECVGKWKQVIIVLAPATRLKYIEINLRPSSGSGGFSVARSKGKIGGVVWTC